MLGKHQTTNMTCVNMNVDWRLYMFSSSFLCSPLFGVGVGLSSQIKDWQTVCAESTRLVVYNVYISIAP